MATTKSKKYLSIVTEYKDGDTRTVTIENPKDNLTADMINATETKAALVLVGDKTGSPFHAYRSAKVVEETVHYLEVTPA